ncbi:glycosyltransferase family 1 protein [Candidatus Parcubacteria bacterium]|nr:MAG: glycosyltransferase family 1 protein [Candidatus Parcubacteria bacterium]
MILKKRILYLITQSEFGGAQRYVYDLATNIKNDFDVLVAAGGRGELSEKLNAAGVKNLELNFKRSISNPFGIIFEIVKLYKLIKEVKPDIVHLNSSKIGVSGSIAAKFTGVKKIFYTAHGFVFNEPLPGYLKRFYLLTEKFSGLFKDKIICVSESDRMQAIMKNVADENKVVTIHNGIGSLEFLGKEEARNELHVSAPLIVGTIANFYATKDLPAFVETAKIVARDFPRCLFVIIGGGNSKIKSELDNLIKQYELENFMLVGSKKNAHRYLKAFDIYACTSVKEGFPYSILEAMKASLPIVSTNVGGIPEMITTEHNGILVNAGDFQAMAQKITELVKNKKKAKIISDNAKETADKMFLLQKMIEKTLLVYNS